MSLLGLPDDVHSLCRNQTRPVSQLQGGQKDEEVGPVCSNKKPLKLIVFQLVNKITQDIKKYGNIFYKSLTGTFNDSVT